MDSEVTLFSASFDTDEEAFVFRDDTFRDTNQPLYADGQRVPAGGFDNGGALRVLLGGIDDADIDGMSGGWDRAFTLDQSQQFTLTFRVKLTQSENYEPGEFSEVLVALDGTLLSTEDGESIARVNGNGNGGGARTTGWLEIEIDLGILAAGDHTLTFGGFNNRKTLANESTEILFDDIEAKVAPPPPEPGEGVLIDANFDTDTNGFLFVDDAFRGTDEPAFADGQRTATDGFGGGGLSVTLGGIDDSDVDGMSGGWQTSFTLAEEAVVTISFRYNLTQASNYEANEFSQVLLSLDGVLVGTEGNDFVAQINGDGNGGGERTTGWQVVEINLGLLGPGEHDLTIGGFNNRKTLADEETTLLIDDVLVRDLPPPPPGDVVLIQSDFDTGTGGFGFIDDAFRDTNQPDYADGQRTTDGGFGGGGALAVTLGGIDNSDVLGMSGGWQQTFTLTDETNVTLTFRFRLTQASNYERDEFSQVLVSLDGTLVGVDGEDFIAEITGNGNGGPDRVVGWQVVELDLGLLGPGEHTLILGGFNNKKTLADEETTILFDDLLLTAEGGEPLPEPPLLTALAGANGFVIAGIDGSDYAGYSVSSVGDVNGDGFDDLILAAYEADGGPDNATSDAGESYVIFGKESGFASVLELSSLDGSNGFVLVGIDADDRSGNWVSGAGDINGDGFADLIIGALDADGGPGNPTNGAGESYVVFGRTSGFGSALALSSLDGSNGFVLVGIESSDFSGASVSVAGDVNGDGLADLIIGAEGADGRPDNTPENIGESYVIFGRTSGFGSVLDLSSLDGSNGFVLTGIDSDDFSGNAVSGAGDVNGDGFADLIVGAQRADGGPGNPADDAGESYVVFGKASGFASALELSSLDGSNGFLPAGIDVNDQSGYAVSGIGDINGDGFADLIVAAPFADGGPGNPASNAGEAYVVFGRVSGFSSVLELSSLDGSDGFVIAGIDEYDTAGNSVSGAGDVNGDGLDDFIVGADGADNTGVSYLIFGRASGFGSLLELDALTPDQGLAIAGIDDDDRSGKSVSGAGDVNGDGFADLIVGADFGDGGPDNTPDEAGESYVIFGDNFTGAVTEQGDATANSLTGTSGADVLLGAQGDDTLVGNGGADVLYGGQGDDFLVISDAALARLNGGTGEDTLRLNGAGFSLDLTALSDLKIEEIEAIDLQDGSGSHSLTLDLQEVLNISDSSNRLTILGDSDDSVDIGAGWTSQGVSGGLETFTQGAATLEIDADIVVTP